MQDFTFYTNIPAVFDHAERYVPSVKTECMYMYSNEGRDYFKNKITRKYVNVPTVGDSVGRPCTDVA